MRPKIAAVTLVLLAATWIAWGTTPESHDQESGFLSDYSKLEPVPGNPADRMYIAPEAPEAFKTYKSVLIEQSEIFISPDSKYKGMKPDEMKFLADKFSGIVADELKTIYTVVEKNGPGVLRFRFALSDLEMKREIPKNPLAYTPAGAAIHYTREALSKNLMKKMKLSQAMLELEILDGGTGEVLAAGTERHSGREVQPVGEEGEKTSWKQVERSMHTTASRLRCRIHNATLAEDARQDCLQLPTEEKAGAKG